MDNLTKEIVVSSRVRLARNFDKYNFPIRLSNDADAKQIQREVFSVVNFLFAQKHGQQPNSQIFGKTSH